MASSRRDIYTKEEREQQVINKPIPNNKLKLSEYLNQPNVKQFNAVCTGRMLDKMSERIAKGIKGRPTLFKSLEECKNDVEGYFKLCYDCSVIPTVSSFCVYIGSNKDYVYETISNNVNDYSVVLKDTIATILSYQEGAVLSNEVPAVPFIFLGKQYYGFKDTQDVNISATNQLQNNADNISAIKNQIELENQKVIEYHDNSN